ncbi:MAG: phosphoribosylanthranilate isomerase [Lachnospiraceae bacterium]|nr:phosphoribosylanthranilate isomerase [Lachnospiraceae bacterium]
MTRIKFCGLTRPCDIEVVNELKPDYIGFVFWQKSKRYITRLEAKELKAMLSKDIKAVGVFVDEDISRVTALLKDGIIDIVQLHGSEDEAYIKEVRKLTGKQIIKAFKVTPEADINKINESSADYVLLDAGMGDGKTFDWDLINNIQRPYFLAGGLDCNNVSEAVSKLEPFAVDVSSGIETDGLKDPIKMREFMSLNNNIGGNTL